MPIARKSKADHQLRQLEHRIKKLKLVMQGKEPNSSLWNFYALNENDYKRDFTEIDQSDLSVALGDIETAIKELKKVKTLKADKLHRDK
jgi:deoxyribodipyrimidine photolyase-like uncharacterized protein